MHTTTLFNTSRKKISQLRVKKLVKNNLIKKNQEPLISSLKMTRPRKERRLIQRNQTMTIGFLELSAISEMQIQVTTFHTSKQNKGNGFSSTTV